MQPNVLTDRDVNQSPKKSSDQKEKPKSMEYHRQVFQSRLQSGQEQQTYVSPSDDIQSPATQKLQAFKNKHVMKKSKPQTLFARTSSRNFEAAKGGLMFADIPKGETKD